MTDNYMWGKEVRDTMNGVNGFSKYTKAELEEHYEILEKLIDETWLYEDEKEAVACAKMYIGSELHQRVLNEYGL